MNGKVTPIKLIEQEDAKGCAVACIAMVTGRTYQDVVKDFHQDFEQKGLTTAKIVGYLANCGFQVIVKKVEFFNEKDFGRKEILKPFAPLHILNVTQFYDSKNTHVVVMDAKGKIYCPSGAKESDIKNSYIVDEIIGLYK